MVTNENKEIIASSNRIGPELAAIREHFKHDDVSEEGIIIETG